ncbi:hypothetical protein HK102_003231 [Quaeritorhiza haematococci]|nr:hypothetical protein HK102_003231 [Quaeritorhiza haematococci]
MMACSNSQEIFEFFGKQLKNVGDTKSPFFSHYFYLLESLSTVKSVVLVADLNAEDLIVEIFQDFFDIIRPDLSKNVHMCMLDILQQLAEECVHLPTSVIDTILLQFRKKRQKENPAAYQLAVDLCNAATDKLQRYVCQYFGDIIAEAGRSVAEEGSDNSDDDSDAGGAGRGAFAGFEEFKSAHDLILEINKTAPGVLLNVIPQLEEELKVETTSIRQLSTQVLGTMFSQPFSGSKLAFTYPQVWKTWQDRRNDKHAPIRITWVEFCSDFFKHQPQLSHDISGELELPVNFMFKAFIRYENSTM